MTREIYSYLDPNLYLRDCWVEKKNSNPSFSMRAWARALGFKNNTVLSLILSGSRPVPKKYLPRLIKSLDLSAKEGRFLEVLIDFKQGKSADSKEFYLNRIKELVPRKSPDLTVMDSFEYLADPIHTLILEMTELSDFENSSLWIQKRLKFKFSQTRIQNAINLLLKMSLLKMRGTKLIKSNRHITNRADVADLGSQAYHRNVATMSICALKEQRVESREFNSYSLNIRKKDIPKAKEMLRKFLIHFISEIEAAPHCGEETYQVVSQFFALTENHNERT